MDAGTSNESTPNEKRRHPRYKFTYPVEFKIFSPHLQSTPVNGFLENISLSGACIQFKDKYGIIRPEYLSDSRVKISIFMPGPDAEKVSILSSVRWKRGDGPERFFLTMGMKFDEIEGWQTERISNFISTKNKDMNMMWCLWDQYKKFSRF